jgi:hypothetical protein
MQKVGRKMPPIRSHQWIDYVDLMMHRAMARKIRRRPTLFSTAGRNIARWEKNRGSCSTPLLEWKKILKENDMRAVLLMITRANEEGNRLRQSSPFVGVLTQAEVRAIWSRYDKERT